MLNFTLTDSQGAVRVISVPVTVDLIDGLEDKDVNFSLYAYPNPTSGKVRIQVNGEIQRQYSLQVFNILGTSVLAKENNASSEETELDLSALPKGIYLIEVTDKLGKSIRRIVKE